MDNYYGDHNMQNGGAQPYYGNTYYGGYPAQPPQPQSPSAIYNNMQNGGAPYGGAPRYHYGPYIPVMNERYYYEQQNRARNMRERKSSVRKGANSAAVSMALYWVLGMVFSTVLIFTRLSLLYQSDSVANSAISIFYSIAVVGIPFLIGNILYKKQGFVSTVTFAKPKAPPFKVVLIILMAFGGCILATFITNIVSVMFESFGISAEIPTSPDPANLTELVISFISLAVVPPLIEEFAMRGVVLGNLRRFGDNYAIIASAFLFGVFHGTATQIPFAFMCGLLIGYAAVETGSIWPGVIIHMLVNSLSCLYPALSIYTDETTADSVVTVVMYAMMFIGAVAFALYLHFYKPVKKRQNPADISTGSKFKAFITNPGIIIMSCVFIFEALAALSFGSTGNFS